MNRYLFPIILLFTTLVMAHPGAGPHTHDKPKALSESEIQAVAKAVVEKKVQEGKLADYWSQAQAGETSQKDFGHGPEWVVHYPSPRNPAEEGKRVLYVFVGLHGKALGINFTGK